MNLSPLPIQKFFDNNGNPLNGGLLFTYAGGTTTKIATYTDSTGGASNTNPIVLDYRGEARVWLDPTLVYKFTLAPPGDTDPPTKPIWTVDQITSAISFVDLTQQLIGLILYPRTPGEIAASVIPTNYWYPPGYWDRYGTNTVPGTTDMSSAASTAYAVAQQGGCSVRYGATAPYRMNSPVNCTNMRGVVTWDESSKKQANAQPSVIIGHTGHGFDLSASTEMSFHDMVGTSLAATVPKTLFFMARNAAASSSGFHRFYNIRTPSNCTFSNIAYQYASEENVYSDCILYNNQPGSSCVNINATNPSGYTSSFLTIATGAQSNASHTLLNTELLNLGNSGGANEVCLALERAQNFTWNTGLAYCLHGLSYAVVSGTTGSNFIAFENVRGETDGAVSITAAIAVRTSAATGGNSHFNWVITNCQFVSTTGYFIDCNSTSDIIGLFTRALYSSNGNQFNLHDLSYSIIEHGQQALIANIAANNVFVGNRAALTLATDTANLFQDQTLGQVGANGVRFPATQVASANANTLDDYEEGTWTPTLTLGTGSVSAYTTQTGTYTKVGRLVTAQANIVVNTVTGGPAGTLKVSGLPFTSTANLKGAVPIFVNTFGAVATPVMAIVDASATTVSIFVLAGGALGNAGGNIGAGTTVAITATYETT